MKIRTHRYLLAVVATSALGVGAALGAVAVSSASAGKQGSPGAARDGVVVHLTHGPASPHHVLMALQMATLMASDHDVLLYADIEGVKMLTKQAPDLAAKPPLASSRRALASLLEKGVSVYACPGCMKVLGVAKGDLLPGVEVAAKERFFSFTKGRILTLGY